MRKRAGLMFWCRISTFTWPPCVWPARTTSQPCAAATRNFLALENHSLDVPFWQDLVNGTEKPIINRGYIKVPDTPGLGITLNDDEVKKHLRPGTGYFEPTPMWNEVQSLDDALWS